MYNHEIDRLDRVLDYFQVNWANPPLQWLRLHFGKRSKTPQFRRNVPITGRAPDKRYSAHAQVPWGVL